MYTSLLNQLDELAYKHVTRTFIPTNILTCMRQNADTPRKLNLRNPDLSAKCYTLEIYPR